MIQRAGQLDQHAGDRLEETGRRGRDILGEVAQTMRDRDTGVAAVAREGRLVGILTTRDLLRAFAARVEPSRAQVRECMTSEPITVSASARVEAAVSLMQEHEIDHLPVVDGERRPVGMLGLRQAARLRRGRGAGRRF
jgi:CBS domain-containing protein